MNLIKKIGIRTFQKVEAIILKNMNVREPILINGLAKLEDEVLSKSIRRILIVMGPRINRLGLAKPLIDGLRGKGVYVSVYAKTAPNPTIDMVMEAYEQYKKDECESIIAFGGGSSMDCAKIVAAKVAQPKKTIKEMEGMFKIRKKIPTLFAVPTTSGSGSEATMVAIITDKKSKRKYPISDKVIIPHYAVIDSTTTVKLPADITATTGMDALTHAIEAYIGRANTRETEKMAKKASLLIFENLELAYQDGQNIAARHNMQEAAYYAGVAFNKALLGHVHSIAHSLGGLYGVAHGYANAILLPYVLEAYGKPAYKRLAELADQVKITKPSDSIEVKAKKLIDRIRIMNKNMGIPDQFDFIQEKDIDLLVGRAMKEGELICPVPRLLDKKEFRAIYYKISSNL